MKKILVLLVSLVMMAPAMFATVEFSPTNGVQKEGGYQYTLAKVLDYSENAEGLFNQLEVDISEYEEVGADEADKFMLNYVFGFYDKKMKNKAFVLGVDNYLGFEVIDKKGNKTFYLFRK